MLCPACRRQNPPDAAFCAHCGSRLPSACVGCGAALPAQARFCPACGHPVQSVPTETHRLELASRSGDTLERRTVTILFSDVKGFSSFSEHLDPEEITEIMNGAFEVLVAPINRYGGTVARLMGDGMLAFFGAPLAHEDDPERAVRAGMEILTEVREYAAGLEATHKLPGFTVRVGVNTGEVVVGDIGAQSEAEYTAMGDAVNVAARLEQAAEPGTVLIGEATQRHITHAFETLALGPLKVHGREQPVEVYRVVAPRSVAAKMRGIPGLATPLVGRQAELNELNAAVARVRSGIGGIVTVVGDAGIGKSRLIAEARAAAADTQWLEGRCLSYGVTTAYHLWLDLMHELLGVAEGAAPDEARRCLRAKLEGLAPASLDVLYPGLARVLVNDNPDADASAPGEQVRRETFAAMEQLLMVVASREPSVVVCEDLHWADPTSLDLLEQAFALTDRAPILFICAFRPDPLHGVWRLRETIARSYPHRHTDIALKPLSASDSESLAHNLLGPLSAPSRMASDMPERLVWRILSHSEGNPFYVEEVIRSLIQSGAVAPATGGGWQIQREIDDLAIPDTLKGVLAARIDRLPRADRRVLQLASVIGRVFSRHVLQAIAGDDLKLDEHLLTLQRDELIRELARLPEVEYTFKHHLTQEAAYDGLLKRDRNAYHRRVAETLERLYAERLDEKIEQLAYHWERAGDLEKACEYLLQAAARARRIGASLEAIEFYRDALRRTPSLAPGSACLPAYRIHELLGDVNLENLSRNDAALEHYAAFMAGAATQAEQARAARKVAGVHLTRGDLAQAERHYELALSNLTEAPASVEANRVHFGLSYLHMSHNRLEQAAQHAEKVLQVAEAIGDTRGLADAYKMLSTVTAYRGQLDDSTRYAELSLAFFQQLNDLARIPIACNNLADSLRLQGRLDAALSVMEEGLRVARQIGDTRDEALLLITTGEVLIDQGRHADAIPQLEQALALSLTSGVTARIIPAQHQLGVACRDAGRLDEARRYLTAAAAASRESHHERFSPWIGLDLARLETLAGRFDAALQQIELVEAAAEAGRSGALTALAEVCRAAVDAENHEWGHAILRLEKSLRFLEDAGHRVEAARARLALGQAYAARDLQGDRALACSHLEAAAVAFEALGDSASAYRSRGEMQQLHCET